MLKLLLIRKDWFIVFMKITDNQNIQTKFLVSRSLFLGGGVSLILGLGEKDAWIGVIIGFLIGIGILYLYTKLSTSIQGTLHNYLIKKTPLNLLLRFLLLLYYLFLIFLLFLVFGTFIYSYYLPFTKTIVSCAPFLFLAIFLGNKGTQAIARMAQILFWVGMSLIIIKTFATAPYVRFENFLPIYTISKTNIFLTALNFAVLTTAPYILLLEEKTSFKNNLKSYTLTFLTLFIMLNYIVGSFGSNLVKTFSYPEFTILRLINFFNFIQNIESFLALSWIFDIFIAISLASKKIKDICHYKKGWITYIILFILLFIVGNFVISDYRITISIYQSFTFVFLLFIIFIFALLGIKKGLTKSTEKCKSL